MAAPSLMKRSSCIVLRPICFFIFPTNLLICMFAMVGGVRDKHKIRSVRPHPDGPRPVQTYHMIQFNYHSTPYSEQMLVVLSLAGVLIPSWIGSQAIIDKEVKLIGHNVNRELLSGIERTSALFSPLNASARNFVRILSSSLDETNLQFSKIESKVASALFQALSTIPNLSQISYIGLDGLFFAYYDQGDQPYALYSNSTFSSTQNDTGNYTWYVQPVDRDTGRLYGEAVKSPPSAVVNSSWFQGALNSGNGFASVGMGWGGSQDVMLLSTVSLGRNLGAVSLGFSMITLIDYLIDEVAFYNGSLCLATTDGNVLTRGLPNSCVIFNGTRVLFHLLGHEDSTVENITCQSHDNILSIWGRNYVISCSRIEIAGLQLAYVLAVPENEFPSNNEMRLAFVLLIVMVGCVVVTVCIFLLLIVKAARREMYLCGALINQMEATQQSERKSMNKSLAFASASHDIRASLAGIGGLIEICRSEITNRDPSRSELLTNLVQMEACTRDLLGILNSILDTSKIEAGKMQLEEEEFDMEQLLEDVVDLYHPVGMKKGVDVILDPHDGTILKSCHVKGDRGKLKQILSNLLSNAVKFTSEGEVTVQCWARKPSLESEILAASNQNKSWSCLFCLLFEIERANSESQGVNPMIPRDPNCMEFVFEVNDTGKGIPKEKQKSVFENYVQVKEMSPGQEGTGLGLGIVQSLVRLMGGEIQILDKEDGERGTCFRFNVLLRRCETCNARAVDIETNGDSSQYSGPIMRNHSPKTQMSQVILVIQNAKRRTVLHTFMQRLGIKVSVIEHHEQLSPTLKRIKQKLHLSHCSSSGKSEGNSMSTRSKEVPLSALDGTDSILESSQKRPSAQFGFVLIVIDTRAGPFREITRAVADFRRDLNESCFSRVVWLDKPDVNNKNFDEDKLPATDFVIYKPFHGSRLYQTIRLLPEFGGIPSRRGEIPHNVKEVQPRNSGATKETGAKRQVYPESLGNKSAGEIEEVEGGADNRKPLMGKKILVADDDPVGRKIATFVASQLGASISSCEHGEAAWKLVCKSLKDKTNAGTPFDYILMDCEMPVMDGMEATARIREAEMGCGVRTPIVALTAHTKGEEIERMVQAGVDGYISKPLNKDSLLKAVSQLTVRS